jgi:8-oxo-(d)GTP phosphatase
MQFVLVRHGHAGRRANWNRPDRLRPLSPLGSRQAQRLVEVIGPMKPTRIVSSPYLRCLQTAEPLASHIGSKIEQSSALVPYAPAKARRFVRKLTGPKAKSGVVVVTHGEIMGDLLAKIANEDGIKLEHRPPGLKGCVWVLEFRRGKLVEARYIPPT